MKSILRNTLLAISFLVATCGCLPEFKNGTSDIDNWEEDMTKYEYNHPCLLHTDGDFAYVKKKVDAKAEPWFMGYEKLKSSTNVNHTPQAVEKVDRSQLGKPGYVDPSKDAEAAYRLALMWRMTGEEQYAETAIKILNAWATINKSMDQGNSDAIISTGYSGYKYANAAEIMRDYSGWKQEDFEAYKKWITNVIYPSCYKYLATHNGGDPKEVWLSWDIPAMASALAIGILCDDNEKVNFALKYFRDGSGSGCIKNAVVAMHEDPAGNVKGAHLAQSMETGREMGHAMTTVSAYGYFCQMAYNIGVDLFAYDDNMVLDICEYLAKYNVYPDEAIDMPFTPYNTLKEGWKSEIGQNDPSMRGQICWGYELIYNHYKKIKGANPYYSQQYARTMRPEGKNFDFGTLMYTREPIEAGEDVKAEPERQ